MAQPVYHPSELRENPGVVHHTGTAQDKVVFRSTTPSGTRTLIVHRPEDYYSYSLLVYVKGHKESYGHWWYRTLEEAKEKAKGMALVIEDYMDRAGVERNPRGLDKFTLAYIEAALWSSTDDAAVPMDTEHSASDLAKETLERMKRDCASFQAKYGELIDSGGSGDEQAGHDFWLTRNGHGAGFWDGDWPEPQATELTEATKSYGEYDLYIGDDGQIYGSGGREQNPYGGAWPHPGGNLDLESAAFDAGKWWRTSGAYYESGVANARVAHYGFVKWYNDLNPHDLREAGTTKGKLEKGWMEGWAAGKRVERKSNPEDTAAAMFETFHGKPSEEIVEYATEEHFHENLSQLGELTELKVATVTKKDVTLDFDRCGVQLACSEDGRQLYLVGGDQELQLDKMGFKGALAEKDSVVVGTLYELSYATEKSFDKFKKIIYFHALGEKTGDQPTLLYDTMNKTLSISGGAYETRAEGIVN